MSETQIPESEQPENRTASSEDSEPTSDTRCGNSAQWSIDAAVAAGSSGADFRSNAEPPESGTRSKQSAHPFSTQDKNRYVTIAELGRGGMGTVVSALDLRLNRQVALKQVTQLVRDSPGMEHRLAREALITAALDHPAIVPVFDAGKNQDGSIFYTMRLVRGRALTEAIKAAKSIGARLLLLRHFLSACEAIAYAHSVGVIHRDVKPDNILVGEFGETQVADWGLARRDQETDAETSAIVPALPIATSAGAILGTPTYMSPEQASGGVIDARSDVFALGVVLHEIICGVPPLSGKTAAEALAALRSGTIPLLFTEQKDAPAELVSIAEKAMQADPQDRYPDARALVNDVSRFLDGRRVSAHPYSLQQEVLRVAKKWRVPLAVAAVFGVLLLLLGIWAIQRTQAERDAALSAERKMRTALAAADDSLAKSLLEQALDAQLVDAQPEAELLAGHALTLTESPEARGVLARFSLADRPLLVDKQVAPTCATARIGNDGSLLCLNHGVLAVYLGRTLHPTWEKKISGQDAIWFGNGQQIVVNQEGSFGALLDAHTGAQIDSFRGRFVAPRGLVGHSAETRGILHHVDGVSVFSAQTRTIANHAPCGGSGTHLVSSFSEQSERIATFCTDGSLIVFGVDGKVQYLFPNVFGSDRKGASAVAVSPDGNRVVVAGLDSDLVVLELPSQNKRIYRHPQVGVIGNLSFSPDGRFLLMLGDRGGVSIWNPDRGVTIRRLPVYGDKAARWSIDGKMLFALGQQLRRWQLPSVLNPMHLSASSQPGIAGIATSSQGDRLAIARGDGSMEVIDALSSALHFRDQFQKGVLKGVSFSERGLIAWAAGSPSFRQYSEAGEVLSTHDFSRLRRAALLPSGWLVSLCYGQGLRLIRLGAASDPPVVIGQKEFIDLDQSGDGKTLVLADLAGDIWLLRDRNDHPEATVLTHAEGVTAVAIGEAAQTIALAKERSIQLIDLTTRKLIREIPSHGRAILDIKLSADGRWLAAGDLDQAARVWSVIDGRLTAVMYGHTGRVSAVAFSPDSERLYTASWDGEPRVFGLHALRGSPKRLLQEIELSWGLDLEHVHRRHLLGSLPSL